MYSNAKVEKKLSTLIEDIAPFDNSYEDVIISGINTNSKKISPGDLFIAIKGEKYDGHNFIKDAEDKGASAIIVNNIKNCLLYTSPSPRDGLLSRMPSSA